MNIFQQHYDAIRQWARNAVDEGWLTAQQLETLEKIEQQQAESLFAHPGVRPLIVALFGGTGVGKSSLLNRLAAEDIARVGVERPTSHEITLYLHDDFPLASLPQELPTEKIRIHTHHDDRRRLIAWLDMPDFDSTEQHNRELVEHWLPYIDWLVYVVTPERYQDDMGWRFLQSRGQRHHWLFVINHWDEGSEEQLEDFRRKLQQEDFKNPVILRTSCLPGHQADDFPKLEQTINSALKQHGLELLQAIGAQARLLDLRQSTERFATVIGQDEQWKNAHKQWQAIIRQSLAKTGQLLNTQLEYVNTVMFSETGGKWFPIFGKTGTEKFPDINTLIAHFWNKRLQTQQEDLIESLQQQLLHQALPDNPVLPLLQQWNEKARTDFNEDITQALQTAWQKPGTWLGRLCHRLLQGLSFLLPLAAIAWAASYAVRRFYQGTQNTAEFLGSEFAIHSLLLIVLAWLLPWLLQHIIKPSPFRSARHNLRRSIADFLVQQHSALETTWQTLQSLRQEKMLSLQSIAEELPELRR
jgi:tRNA U34 5-carboxymethylaminomethyl modifying GTPase MnmE/TrmE